VREESHLDDMRSAIRGDFERLAERRGEQGLMRVAEPGSEEEHKEELVGGAESEPEVVHEPLPEVASEPEAVTDPEAPLEAEPEPPRRSWLARLFSA